MSTQRRQTMAMPTVCCHKPRLKKQHTFVGLTPTDIQRNETESQARLISRPDRGRQPTDGCIPLLHCAYTKGGKGLEAHTTKFAMT
jgi:hypothetical protein